MRHLRGPSNNQSWSRRYDYFEENNRLRRTSAPGDAIGTYSDQYRYDTNDGGLHGSMTQMPHLAALEWDYADRLKHTLKSDGSAQDTYFTYDAAGQRVRKVYVHDGLIEERIYLGGYEVYRRHTSGSITPTPHEERQTLHVMDDARRVAMVETKTRDAGAAVANPVSRWRFQLDNHLGSATLELDDGGNVISYEEYHPYGSTAFHTANAGAGVSAKRYRYTGKEKDDETELYYHGARYYAPWLGRWTAADPSGVRGGLNLYEYAASNPIRLVDPQGHEPLDPSNRNVQRLRAKGLTDAQIQGLIQNPPGLRRNRAPSGGGGGGGQAKQGGGAAGKQGGAQASGGSGGSAGGGNVPPSPETPPAQPPPGTEGGSGAGKGGGGETSTAEDVGRVLSQAAGALNLQGVDGTEGGSKYGSPLGQNKEAEANVISQIGTAIVGIAVGIWSAISIGKAAAGAYAAAKAAFAEAFAAGAGAFRSFGAKIAYGVGRLLGNIGKAGPVPKIDPPKTIPQGFSEAEFASASEVIRSQTTHLGDDIFVHGSRASGTAKATSDIDFGIRVTPDRFEELVRLRFGTPTPGSAKFRTMEHALKTGKIQAGEAGLRGLRTQLERTLGREVDISVIRAGGAFDKGPYIPIR